MNELKLQQFYDHLQKNPDCQKKANEFGDDTTALAAYALELGYAITAEDLTAFMSKAKQVFEAKWKELDTAKTTMSAGEKQFMEFSKLADTDTEVAKRIAELSKSPQELIAYGKGKGFSFDTNDMKEVAKKLMEQEEELSDEELEAVAGGSTMLLLVLAFMSAAVVGGAVVAGAGVAAGAGAVAVCVLSAQSD